jgi:hypothetical protein
MQQQILGRITADTQFGKDNQVSAQLIARARCVGNDFLSIAGDIANGKIDLG